MNECEYFPSNIFEWKPYTLNWPSNTSIQKSKDYFFHINLACGKSFQCGFSTRTRLMGNIYSRIYFWECWQTSKIWNVSRAAQHLNQQLVTPSYRTLNLSRLVRNILMQVTEPKKEYFYRLDQLYQTYYTEHGNCLAFYMYKKIWHLASMKSFLSVWLFIYMFYAEKKQRKVILIEKSDSFPL